MLCECVPSPRAGPDALRLSVRCVPSSTDLATDMQQCIIFQFSCQLSHVSAMQENRKNVFAACALWTWGTSIGTTHMCEFRDRVVRIT